MCSITRFKFELYFAIMTGDGTHGLLLALLTSHRLSWPIET